MTTGARRRVAAILTVHDRAPLTLACLDALAAQQHIDVEVEVWVCDDGSTDGTAARVRERHPGVHIVGGTGDLWWNGGMRAAWHAARETDPDLYLWLNDDTRLDRTALRRLLVTFDEVAEEHGHPVIVVGTVRDPGTGRPVYGGVRQGRIRRLAFRLLHPGGLPRPADTMNGNVVLVPRAVVDRIGILDPAYRHAMGDYDYGLRARAAGVGVWVAPGTVGECRPNPGFQPRPRGVLEEWRRLRSTRYLPPADWRAFAVRWGGPAWPLLWAASYGRRLVQIVRAQRG